MAKFDFSHLEEERFTLTDNGYEYVVPKNCRVKLFLTHDGVLQAVTLEHEIDDEVFEQRTVNKWLKGDK